MTETIAVDIGRLCGDGRHPATEPDKSRSGSDENPEHHIDSHVVPPQPPLPYLNARSCETLPIECRSAWG
jgi:hypothetical protein